MAMNFSDIDSAVDHKDLQKSIQEAKNNSGDIPKGKYMVGIDKMELRKTKDGRPMFFVQARVREGRFKKHCVFMNRVVYGTKNDGSMIQSVLTFLEKFQTDTVPEFVNYTQFAECIADIYEEIQGKIECEIQYDRDAFNSISITEDSDGEPNVFDI